MFAIETEFLFSLDPENRFNKKVAQILDLAKHKKIRVICLASGFLEAIFVLKSRGMKESAIRSVMAAMISKLKKSAVDTIEPITMKALLGSLVMRERYVITFYDAMHASMALNASAVLISNDKVYDNIRGIKRVSFSTLVKNA